MPETPRVPDAKDVKRLDKLRNEMSDYLVRNEPVPDVLTKRIIRLMEKTGIAEEMIADEFLPEPQPRWSDASIKAAIGE